MSLSSAERQRFVGLLQQMETSIGASSIAQFVQDHNLNWDHLQSSHKRLALFLRMLDSNQVGERQNAGRLAAKYIKELGLTYDDVIGADLPPEGTWTDEPEAEWEPEPEANWEPEPNRSQSKSNQSTSGRPMNSLSILMRLPGSLRTRRANRNARQRTNRLRKALDEARAAREAATSDELTVTQRVVAVVVKLAVAIPLMFATKWFFKNALTPTQALVVSVLGLTGMTVWWIVKLIRRLNTMTALRHEKAWRRSYIEPHSINMG